MLWRKRHTDNAGYFEGIPLVMVTEGGKRGLNCAKPVRVEISTDGPYSWASTVGHVKIF
jgi:hypothetical protein